jgi:hypothetical protein
MSSLVDCQLTPPALTPTPPPSSTLCLANERLRNWSTICSDQKRRQCLWFYLIYAHSSESIPHCGRYQGIRIWAFVIRSGESPLDECICKFELIFVHCKKSCAKFRCGQRWREPNDVGVGKFPFPQPLVLRHRCQHRNLAHSDMAFLQCNRFRYEWRGQDGSIWWNARGRKSLTIVSHEVLLFNCFFSRLCPRPADLLVT